MRCMKVPFIFGWPVLSNRTVIDFKYRSGYAVVGAGSALSTAAGASPPAALLSTTLAAGPALPISPDAALTTELAASVYITAADPPLPLPTVLHPVSRFAGGLNPTPPSPDASATHLPRAA